MSTNYSTHTPRFGFSSQRGATIATFALMLLFLIGVAGIALDFGRLFIVKTELQTAMDSCALSGAQELDGKTGAMMRARKAAVLAGNLNPVNLQSANWDGKGQLVEADVELLDASRGIAVSDTASRYVRCKFTQKDVRLWLLHLLGASQNDRTTYSGLQSVYAEATATRGSAQSTCPIPVGLIAAPGQSGPDYGRYKGEWVVALSAPNSQDEDLVAGEMGWFNLDGTQGASITNAQLSEKNHCGTEIDQEVPLLTPGQKTAVSEQWNYRFGLYTSDSVSRAENRPDMSGYGYRPATWPAGENAFPDFLTKRASFMPFQETKPPFKSTATTQEHQQYGYNRRVVLVPVLTLVGERDYKIIDFACMFLLSPMKVYKEDLYMEYLGNASESSSPCTSGGKPGGITGPLVPNLVR